MSTSPSSPGFPHEGIRKRRLLRVSADAVILALLFSTLFSSLAMTAVACVLLVSVLVHAWFGLHRPERDSFILHVLIAGTIAGSIAAGKAACSR